MHFIHKWGTWTVTFTVDGHYEGTGFDSSLPVQVRSCLRHRCRRLQWRMA